MHIRTQIRNKVKDVLKAQKIRAVDSVYGTLSDDNLPCVIVEIPQCDISQSTVGIMKQRDFIISLRIVNKAYKGVDDAVDAIIAKIEKALLNDPFFDESIQPLQEKIEVVEGGDQSIRIMNQTLLFTVITSDCEEILS